MELEQYTKGVKEFIGLEKNTLEKITPAQLHSENKFEYGYCREGFHGKKNELIMRYVYFENMNISNLIVSTQTVFVNCVFENVKLKKCKFENALFINCKFINSSIIECSITDGQFINCIDLEKTQIIENVLTTSSIIGSQITEDYLEDNSNVIRDITITCDKRREANGIEVVSIVSNDKKETEATAKEGEKMEQEIISKKTYEDETFTEQYLKNKLFDNCNFLKCKFDEKINLGATTDFIKCNFENSVFSEGKYDKVAFDQSSFDNAVFIGDFIRCNFTRCTFEDCKVEKTAHFFTCNFDFSNAYDKFAIYQEQFTDVILNVEPGSIKELPNDNIEISELLKPIYEYLKQNDDELQEELNELRKKQDLTDDSVDQYLLLLNDIEFMKFISRITLKRTNQNTDSISEVPTLGKQVI